MDSQSTVKLKNHNIHDIPNNTATHEYCSYFMLHFKLRIKKAVKGNGNADDIRKCKICIGREDVTDILLQIHREPTDC
jgi:hypothetical protein